MAPAYQPTPLAKAWAAALSEGTPRIALGNFLDDWRRFPDPQRRALLVEVPIADETKGDEDAEDAAGHLHRWACFMAAAVEFLTVRDGVPTPDWVYWDCWTLSTPWFMFPHWKLRAWQLAATPPPWKRRRIFGGDATALIGRV